MTSLFSRLIAALFTLGCFGGGGGGGGGGISGSMYKPTGLGNADQMWQNLMGSQLSVIGDPKMWAAIQPQLEGLYPQLVGNLGNAAPGIESVASGQVAPYLQNMAGQADAYHNLMSGIGNTDAATQQQLLGAGTQAWNTALDPQKALYDRTQQQVQDQSRANASAAGLGTSPYAVGLENQANTNFNIDWQNQQLQRQLSGLQGLGTAATQAGKQGEGASQQYTGAQAMSALAPQLLMQAAQTPYQTTADLINQGFTNAEQYASALGSTQLSPLGNIMGEILPYLNYGTGAQANAFGATQANLGNLVGAGGLLSNYYGMGPGQGYGPLSTLAGMFSSNPFSASTLASNPYAALTGGEIGAGGIGGMAAGEGAMAGGGLSLADFLAIP